jgi:hypothetical protein
VCVLVQVPARRARRRCNGFLNRVSGVRFTPGDETRIEADRIPDRFSSVFEGMDLEPLAGMTVITGRVADQAHLMGLIEQIQELGLELVSVTPAEG